jgi:hypothetical protein
VSDERDLRARLSLRDKGLRRLKALTGLLVVAMTALAGIFVAIAAAATPGRKLIRVQPRTTAARVKPGASRTRSTSVPPPALPALGSQAASPPPAAPAQPPAAAPPAAPPVVVSGGS